MVYLVWLPRESSKSQWSKNTCFWRSSFLIPSHLLPLHVFALIASKIFCVCLFQLLPEGRSVDETDRWQPELARILRARVLGVSFSVTCSRTPHMVSRFDINQHFQIDCWKVILSSAKAACEWAMAGGKDVMGSRVFWGRLFHLNGTARVVVICGKV